MVRESRGSNSALAILLLWLASIAACSVCFISIKSLGFYKKSEEHSSGIQWQVFLQRNWVVIVLIQTWFSNTISSKFDARHLCRQQSFLSPLLSVETEIQEWLNSKLLTTCWIQLSTNSPSFSILGKRARFHSNEVWFHSKFIHLKLESQRKGRRTADQSLAGTQRQLVVRLRHECS